MLTKEERWACRYAKHLESDSESEYDEDDDYDPSRLGPADRGDQYSVSHEHDRNFR